MPIISDKGLIPHKKWTKKEKEQIIDAIKLHGRDWLKITELVGTRSYNEVYQWGRSYLEMINKDADDPS